MVISKHNLRILTFNIQEYILNVNLRYYILNIRLHH